MDRWISSKSRRMDGIYKEMLQVRVPRKMKTLIEKRAREKGMSISEYVRSLVHKDLEGVYERTNP
jgi:predicted DNA binding CopG/RHH family protein